MPTEIKFATSQRPTSRRLNVVHLILLFVYAICFAAMLTSPQWLSPERMVIAAP